jgi:hypothetical protein
MKKEANMDLLEAKWQPAAPKNIEKKNRKWLKVKMTEEIQWNPLVDYDFPIISPLKGPSIGDNYPTFSPTSPCPAFDQAIALYQGSWTVSRPHLQPRCSNLSHGRQKMTFPVYLLYCWYHLIISII